jgi:hypothetical protein
VRERRPAVRCENSKGPFSSPKSSGFLQFPLDFSHPVDFDFFTERNDPESWQKSSEKSFTS